MNTPNIPSTCEKVSPLEQYKLIQKEVHNIATLAWLMNGFTITGMAILLNLVLSPADEILKAIFEIPIMILGIFFSFFLINNNYRYANMIDNMNITCRDISKYHMDSPFIEDVRKRAVKGIKIRTVVSMISWAFLFYWVFLLLHLIYKDYIFL